MLKRLLMLVFILFGLVLWAVPQEWSVDVSRVQPYQFNAYHGETMELKASFFLRGQPYDVGGEDFALFWQTNGMGAAYWSAPATAASNTVSAVFTGAMDPGAPLVYGFLGSTGSNYRASFAIRFAASPGAVPNELPLPVETIDFSKVDAINAPWATWSEIDEGLAVVASSATNYTDTVAASLGALAWVDSVDWADILGKPSWIGSSKPSYSLNEICPDSENWLGVQGNAGRHIKVLAGTVGGQIVGGLRVTSSAQNDNNMTTYTYGGVAVRRNGTNTDYVFDESSDNGIVRRSELAELAPGDYANVSNRAVHALGNTGDQNLDGNLSFWSGRLAFEFWDALLQPVMRVMNNTIYFPSQSGGLALTAGYGHAGNLAALDVYGNPVDSGIAKTAVAPLASPAFTGTPTAPTPASGDNSTKVATTEFVQEAISGSSWSATNTVAVIARHTGKETVSIPSGGNLVADLSGWNDGVQTFVVLQPSGAYTVASNVEYCGYGTWPTNTALCVAWPYDGTLYVNPITIIRE